MTCSTCKHWRKIRDENYAVKDVADPTIITMVWPGPHGECMLMADCPKPGIAWVYACDSNNAPPSVLAFITKPEFGCILWKKLGVE